MDLGADLFEVEPPVPSNPVDITPGWLNFSPYNVFIDGDYAYVAAGFNGLHMWDISEKENPVWLNSVSIDDELLCVAVSGDYAYAGSSQSHQQLL